RPFDLAHDTRQEHRPEPVARDDPLRFLVQLGVKLISSSSVTACRAYAGGLVGNGCVGDVFSIGTSDCGTGFSSIGHTGWPVMRSNTYRNASLLGSATALIALPLTLMSIRIGAD